jgi:hypothetical protein
MNRFGRYVIAAQGGYYLVTGFWPLVSMSSFEAVTGPKIEHWLVHTVGVLAMAIGFALLVAARRKFPSDEALALSAAAATAFAGIDVVYSLRGTISEIYLADAAVQAVFLAAVLVTRFAGPRASGDA